MHVRILGCGLYGAHLAKALIADGHGVEVHEIADRIFAGATGNIPARLHAGQHYPRSKLTRDACRQHYSEFMTAYGEFTHGIPVNIYAVAEYESLIDFGTYRQILKDEIELITLDRPEELGLQNVEGAILTGERHVLADRLAAYFERELDGVVQFGKEPGTVDDPRWDLTIDCTSCANDGLNVDRYEACLTLLLKGPTDRAVTIMDGPFPSLYPWDEERGLSSLTSAKWTPMARCDTWADAHERLYGRGSIGLIAEHSAQIFNQMAHYYPPVREEYHVVDHRLSIRAMPRSAADARLVDVVRIGERAIRVRAGKLDAIFHAEKVIREMLPEFGHV